MQECIGETYWKAQLENLLKADKRICLRNLLQKLHENLLERLSGKIQWNY